MEFVYILLHDLGHGCLRLGAMMQVIEPCTPPNASHVTETPASCTAGVGETCPPTNASVGDYVFAACRTVCICAVLWLVSDCVVADNLAVL